MRHRFGNLSVLVNNAGLAGGATFGSSEEAAAWPAIIATNLTGAWLCAREASPLLTNDQGRIINICSVQSELGRPGISPYMASKGALKMLTKGMAIDWGPLGLNVNGIGPGYFKTELNEKLVKDDTFSNWLINRTPSRRWGNVEELAGAAVFLASSASSFVNGHILYVDGGVTAQL